MNPKVDFYFNKAKKWQDALEKLRIILNDCPLVEDLKWGVPCYTYNKKNVVLIHDFKEYCALLFVKGSLINDPHGFLIQQTENVQAARQVRFTDVSEIIALEFQLREYILQAIEIEKARLKVQLKKPEEFKMAEEFKLALENSPALKAAFERLTPGRQRAYLLHFSAPKQSKTREARVLKYTPVIMEGKGLND